VSECRGLKLLAKFLTKAWKEPTFAAAILIMEVSDDT
jgi:hypothetical protein